MNKYGLRLKELREKHGYTQDTLAEALNTTRSRISNYELGIRQPDFEMQEAIADLFNVTIDYLFGRDEKQVIVESPYNDETIKRALEYYERISKLTPDKQAALLTLLDTLQEKP